MTSRCGVMMRRSPATCRFSSRILRTSAGRRVRRRPLPRARRGGPRASRPRAGNGRPSHRRCGGRARPDLRRESSGCASRDLAARQSTPSRRRGRSRGSSARGRSRRRASRTPCRRREVDAVQDDVEIAVVGLGLRVLHADIASSTESGWNAKVSLRISDSGIDGAARSTHTWTPEAGFNQARSNFVACSVRPSRCTKMVISRPPSPRALPAPRRDARPARGTATR